jgi:hypothetical protein
MPNPHRRVGLVVDETVASALHVFRGEALPEAAVLRRAVLEGSVVEAIAKAAAGNGPEQERAAELMASLRALLPSLGLDGHLERAVSANLGHAIESIGLSERRRRQFALLEARPESAAQSAQDLADSLDAFERWTAP